MRIILLILFVTTPVIAGDEIDRERMLLTHDCKFSEVVIPRGCEYSPSAQTFYKKNKPCELLYRVHEISKKNRPKWFNKYKKKGIMPSEHAWFDYVIPKDCHPDSKVKGKLFHKKTGKLCKLETYKPYYNGLSYKKYCEKSIPEYYDPSKHCMSDGIVIDCKTREPIKKDCEKCKLKMPSSTPVLDKLTEDINKIGN